MIVTIKPAPSSGKFFRRIGGEVSLYDQVDNNGEKIDVYQKPYAEERLPGTVQIERPILFKTMSSRWGLYGHLKNSDELDSLVKSCRLINDLNNHPDKGKMIVHCDINDSNDPFFKNKALKVRLAEGSAKLDTSLAINKILYDGMLANKRFQLASNDNSTPRSGSAKYLILSEELTSVSKKSKMDNEIEAIDLFRSLSDQKKKDIAFITEIIRVNTDSVDLFDNLLYEYVKDSKTKATENKTRQEYFIHLCKLPPEDLAQLSIVSKGLKKGVIKRYSDRYEAFGIVIGSSKETSIKFLLNPDNADLFIKLQSALEL